MSKLLNYVDVGLERIEWQNDNVFVRNLVDACRILKMTPNIDSANNLSLLLSKRFNIPINLILDTVNTNFIAYTLIPITVSASYNEDTDDILASVINGSDVKLVPPDKIFDTGYSLDLKNAVVKWNYDFKPTDIFSTIFATKHVLYPIYLSTINVFELFDPDEIAAVILHEVGHIFHHLYMQGTLNSISAVIAEAKEAINTKKINNTSDKITEIFYTFNKHNIPINKPNTSNRIILTLSLGNQIRDYLTAEMFSYNDLYIIGENEADSFATRFNLSTQLSTATAKIASKLSSSIIKIDSYKTVTEFIVKCSIIPILFFIALMAGPFFLIPIAYIIGPLFVTGHDKSIIQNANTLQAIKNCKTLLVKTKQEYIQRLKELNLTLAIKASCIKNINLIDIQIDSLSKLLDDKSLMNSVTIIDKIFNTNLYKLAKYVDKDTDLSKAEDIVNNDIYLKSAEIEQLLN